MDRRTARETAFSLIFESEFQHEHDKEEILALAVETREIEEDNYVFTCLRVEGEYDKSKISLKVKAAANRS